MVSIKNKWRKRKCAVNRKRMNGKNEWIWMHTSLPISLGRAVSSFFSKINFVRFPIFPIWGGSSFTCKAALVVEYVTSILWSIPYCRKESILAGLSDWKNLGEFWQLHCYLTPIPIANIKIMSLALSISKIPVNDPACQVQEEYKLFYCCSIVILWDFAIYIS